MNSLVSSLIGTLASMVMMVVDVAVANIVRPLSMNPAVFKNMFGTFFDAYLKIIIPISIFLATVLLIFALLSRMSDASNRNTESPIKLIARWTVSVFLVLYIVQILSGIVGFSQNGILGGNFNLRQVFEETTLSVGDGNIKAFEITDEDKNFSLLKELGMESAPTDMDDSPYKLTGDLAKAQEGSNENSAITNAVGFIISAFVVIGIGVSLIKYLFEILERYLIMFVYIMLAPFFCSLCASPGMAEQTKKYLQAFFSTVFVYFLNMMFLKIILGSISLINISSTNTNVLLNTALIYSLIHIAMSLDKFMSTYFSTFSTQGALGTEMYQTVVGLNSVRGILGGTKNAIVGGAKNIKKASDRLGKNSVDADGNPKNYSVLDRGRDFASSIIPGVKSPIAKNEASARMKKNGTPYGVDHHDAGGAYADMMAMNSHAHIKNAPFSKNPQLENVLNKAENMMKTGNNSEKHGTLEALREGVGFSSGLAGLSVENSRDIMSHVRSNYTPEIASAFASGLAASQLGHQIHPNVKINGYNSSGQMVASINGHNGDIPIERFKTSSAPVGDSNYIKVGHSKDGYDSYMNVGQAIENASDPFVLNRISSYAHSQDDYHDFGSDFNKSYGSNVDCYDSLKHDFGIDLNSSDPISNEFKDFGAYTGKSVGQNGEDILHFLNEEDGSTKNVAVLAVPEGEALDPEKYPNVSYAVPMDSNIDGINRFLAVLKDKTKA